MEDERADFLVKNIIAASKLDEKLTSVILQTSSTSKPVQNFLDDPK